MISSVYTEDGSWVVIHRDNDALTVPESIGHAQIHIGQNSDIKITLDDDETLESDDKVWAMYR